MRSSSWLMTMRARSQYASTAPAARTATGTASTPSPSSETAPVARRRRSSARVVSKTAAASGVTGASAASAGGIGVAVLDEQLARVEPRQLVGERTALPRSPATSKQLEVLGVGIERGDADPAARRRSSATQRDTARRVEQLRLDDHAGAEHAGHLAPHQPAGDHLADLVPDGDPLPGVEELADVLRDRLVGHAAHRQPAGGAEPAAGELRRRGSAPHLGVVAEHLEEVAEAGEHDRVGVIGLDGAVLAEDRRVARPSRGRALCEAPRHRRDEVRSPNLRARSHAAVPTGSSLQLPCARRDHLARCATHPAARRPRAATRPCSPGCDRTAAPSSAMPSTRISTRAADVERVARRRDLALHGEQVVEPRLLLRQRARRRPGAPRRSRDAPSTPRGARCRNAARASAIRCRRTPLRSRRRSRR